MAKAVSDLRRMQRSQLSRLTKEELMDSILSAPEARDEQLLELTNKLHTLVNEVADLKKAVTASSTGVNIKIDHLQDQVNKQNEIISKQQRYLEYLDRKDREKNLIVTGVPDENEALMGATNDGEKLGKIWSEAGIAEDIQGYRRLGTIGEGRRCRAILLTVNNREARDRVLAKAPQLKQGDKSCEKIFIKKDVHPSIRNEWKRLRDAEKVEKERPENVGCEIRLDTRERKLYKDGVVIDSWSQLSF